jgi:glycolate oxidase iron-sulfur subunit
MPTAGASANPGIVALADQCVRCGLCLPHCPSYRVSPQEGDSPRGRIAFARALATGEVDSSGGTLVAHLDRCLGCGTCERVCPSGVRYDELIGLTRTLPGARTSPRGGAMLRLILRHPRALRIVLALARLARRLAGPALRRRLPPFANELLEQARSVPRSPPAVAYTPAARERRGTVALFRGCAASVLDADTQQATVELLSQLGYDVHAPRDGQCCGALARHAGAAAEAERVAHAAGELLATLPARAVIGTASGCQRDLETRVLGASELPAHGLFPFLAADPEFMRRSWRVSPRHAAVLTPCTEGRAHTEALALVLGRVSGLKLTWLTQQPRCCGAAGSFFLEQPELAEPLRAERVSEIAALKPDLVLTTNVGCRGYLGSGLRRAGIDLPVLHPAALLAECIEP